jgi:putative glycosyltransferase (TIGR04372 family)
MFNKSVRKRFLIVLKNRDYSAIVRALLFVVFRFMGLLFALPAILILWILKPIVWLKVGRLHSDRLGHLAKNTELFLRRRQLGIHRDDPYYFFVCCPKDLANRQLLTMFKRVLHIYESRILTLMFNGMLPLLKRTPFYQDLGDNSNEYYEFNNANSSLYFTPDEIEKGRKIFQKINVDFDKDEYVCIFSRDDAYLKNKIPHHNWDYHNTRDSDIDGLIETAKYLIEKGFTVIRVGSIVKKPINFSHEKMIDLPYSGHRSEFMDIFILAHCKFIITGGSSGITDVTDCFDIPRLSVSLVEFGYIPISKNCLYTPKKFRCRNTNDYLHFKEACKMDNYWWCYPEVVGLEAEETSPREILEATKEMLDRLDGNFKYSPEEEKLIQAYNKLWSESGLQGSPSKAPIGIAWLKQNQDLYF